MRRLAVLALLVFAAPAFAERPQVVLVPQDVPSGPLTPTGLAPYNTIFLNRCAGGCLIRVGPSDSINDRWQISANATLSAWPYDDATWTAVMNCVKDDFSPYNVVITDVDPGTASHFEIMIAGAPGDLGMPAAYGGVAPGGCTTTYLDNALVFDFAKVWGAGATCDAGCIEDICSTAAQEIGHTFKSMDHVTVAADPMTYFYYADRRYFQDTAAQCGSDCQGGVGPGNVTCTGTNLQNHVCRCTTSQTQNSHQVLLGLFGAGAGTPPTVTITGPKDGASVQEGFVVNVDAQDDSNRISKVELRIDNTLVGTSMNKPFVFNAPASLGNGTHMLEATAYDPHGTPGKGTASVFIGGPCNSTGDCTRSTDVCAGGRCVPGPSVTGGLGTSCTMATDCFSNQCAFDGTAGTCVEPCMEAGQCPSGFGCLDTGTGQMVCYKGYNDGSGCGCQAGGRGAPMTLLVLLGIAGLIWRRRAL